MKKFVSILVVSAKGDLLMRLKKDNSDNNSPGIITAFGGVRDGSSAPVKEAVRVLGAETGLDVRSEDLEFLDSYSKGEAEDQVFVLAGVDEDRIHAYGENETLYKVRRNDDFGSLGLSVLAQKYVADYFKRHKKW